MKPGKDYVGIFVTAFCNDGAGNILLGKRGGQARDRHGMWEFGGGTLEVGETIEDCLIREYKEEFGATLSDIKQIKTLSFIDEQSHWLGVFHSATVNRDEVYIAEPVYDEIGWFTADTLPTDMDPQDVALFKSIVT